MFKQFLLSLMAVLFVSSTVSAAVVFNPSVFYYTREDNDSEFNQQIINLKLGYVSPEGLYLGVAYDMESRDYGSASDTDRDSLGGTIGYVSGGWQLLGTYYFQSDYEEEEGTGYAVDVGYIFGLGGSMGIGPLLSYRHFTYDENSSDTEHKNFLPAVQFQFTF
jgi:hypothetical protein